MTLKYILTGFLLVSLLGLTGCSKTDSAGGTATATGTTATTEVGAESDMGGETDPDQLSEILQEAQFERGLESFEEADTLYGQALEIDPKSADANFGRACNYVAWGKNDEALKALSAAVDLGYNNAEELMTLVDLDPIREVEGFSAILEKVKANNGGAADAGDMAEKKEMNP